MSLKSHSWDSRFKVPLEDLGSGLYRAEKIHLPQPDLNPRIMDLEASTVPRDHQGRQFFYNNNFLISLYYRT